MGALTHNGEVLQSLPANASQINFDKTGTDLNATQVENAIKEVNGKVNTNAEDITQLKSGLTDIQNQSGEVASGIIEGTGTVDIQLPAGVAAYLLCTYRDNDYFAGLYYLTYKVGDKITSSPILTNANITVTGDLSDRHITIANGSNYPCCYAIKNLAHAN